HPLKASFAGLRFATIRGTLPHTRQALHRIVSKSVPNQFGQDQPMTTVLAWRRNHCRGLRHPTPSKTPARCEENLLHAMLEWHSFAKWTPSRSLRSVRGTAGSLDLGSCQFPASVQLAFRIIDPLAKSARLALQAGS